MTVTWIKFMYIHDSGTFENTFLVKENNILSILFKVTIPTSCVNDSLVTWMKHYLKILSWNLRMVFLRIWKCNSKIISVALIISDTD